MIPSKLVRRLVSLERERKDMARELRSLRLRKGDDILEESIAIGCTPTKPSGRIAGVDGGSIKRSLQGMDLVLVRAIGVVFDFKDGKLESVAYHPSPIPSPKPLVALDLTSDLELEMLSSLERHLLEQEVAMGVVRKHRPDVLLLHGPLIPFQLKAMGTKAWKKLLRAARKLIGMSDRCVIAGIIEDSRSRRLCELLSQRKDLRASSMGYDVNLLTHLLRVNERTFIFTNPIGQSFGLYSFYLRTAELAGPIKVEVPSLRGVDKLVSTLLSLCGHAGYGMPSILIEADQRVRLTDGDFELFYHELIERVGPLTLVEKRRRERRPF